MTSNHAYLPGGGGDRTNRPHAYPPHRSNDRHYLTPIPSSSSSSASLKGHCCCLFSLLIFLALLAVAAALFIALVVRPKKPSFDLNRVAFTYLFVDSAYLTLNLNLLFTAVNPNKVEIRYSKSVFYVMYHGVPLGVAAVPGFDQPAHSTRLVQTRVSVSRFDVMQADALDLVKDASVNDRIELRITGDVRAKIRFLRFTSPWVQVAVDCAVAISPRKQSVTYRQCGVDGLSV